MALRSRRSGVQVPSMQIDKLEGAMTDKQLVRFARSFRDGIIKDNPWTALRPVGKPKSFGMCFQVSAPLQGLLSAHGFETSLETVDFIEINHTFLRLPDGRILDATADQFGLEPVYLGPMPDEYQALIDRHAAFVAAARTALKQQPRTRRSATKAKRAATTAASEAQE